MWFIIVALILLLGVFIKDSNSLKVSHSNIISKGLKPIVPCTPLTPIIKSYNNDALPTPLPLSFCSVSQSPLLMTPKQFKRETSKNTLLNSTTVTLDDNYTVDSNTLLTKLKNKLRFADVKYKKFYKNTAPVDIKQLPENNELIT